MAGDGSVTDPSCKDALRLYYGSPRCRVKTNWSVLGKGTLDYVMGEYEKAFPPRRALQTPLRVVDHAPARGLVEWKKRRIVEAVRGAAPGERHLTLLRRAREADGTDDAAPCRIPSRVHARPKKLRMRVMPCLVGKLTPQHTIYAMIR